jgi:hypothetical protein
MKLSGTLFEVFYPLWIAFPIRAKVYAVASDRLLE